MRTKRNLLRNGVILATSILSVSMCFSIGFASWVTVGGDFGNLTGDMHADSYQIISQEVSCIKNLNIDDYSSCQKYGFSVDGIFTNSITISGGFDFDVATAISLRGCDFVSTHRADFTLRFFSNAFSSLFVSSGITLSGSSNESSGALSYVNSVGFLYTFSLSGFITDSKDESYVESISYTFDFDLTFDTSQSGASIGNNGTFPSFASNPITLFIDLEG